MSESFPQGPFHLTESSEDDRPDTPSFLVLYDEWERRGPILLSGWFERNQFHPLVLAMIVSVAAFMMFLVIGNLAGVLLIFLTGDVSADMPPAEMFETILRENPMLLLAGNTIGQIFGLALPVILLAVLHSRRRSAFLRLRPPDPALFLLATAGLIALIPMVQWLGSVNELLPLPDAIREMERVQTQFIEEVLMGTTGVLPNLLFIAVVPALCEELLFRGYVQRQAERGMGVVWGIVFTGIIFGMYHLRLSQVLPLAVLGIYIGYAAWRTGSLWTAIGVHFLNNAVAVAIAAYVVSRGDLDLHAIEDLGVPWYVAFLGLLVAVFVIRAMNQRARQLLSADRHAEGSGAGL